LSEDTSAGASAGDDAAVLLDLAGLAVIGVRRGPDGVRTVWVRTACETAQACPSCGVFSSRSKGVVLTHPRDLPCGGGRLDLVWVKHRWYCTERRCPRTSFTETLPVIPRRARLTARLRAEAGDRVKDGTCATVIAAARQSGLSWPTVMDALRQQATDLDQAAPPPVDALGIDEVRRGRPRWRPPAPAVPADPPAPSVPADPAVPAGPPVQAVPGVRGEIAGSSLSAEPVAPEREPARARVLADRWHVGFTDVGGGQGMLGQVEGRTADDVAYWLAMQPAAWRERIRYVAIDMCTVFVSAVRRYLPDATLAVDHFHVVKLAGDVVDEVRRRTTTVLRGRRGRRSDPEWKVRNLLRRNREALSPKAFAKLWNTLVDLGDPGVTILKAWIAKDLLRRVLALAGTGADRSVISHRLYRFYTWCADAAVPELERLAATIETWWPAIEAFLHTKITNDRGSYCTSRWRLGFVVGGWAGLAR
jgi:transposase